MLAVAFLSFCLHIKFTHISHLACNLENWTESRGANRFAQADIATWPTIHKRNWSSVVSQLAWWLTQKRRVSCTVIGSLTHGECCEKCAGGLCGKSIYHVTCFVTSAVNWFSALSFCELYFIQTEEWDVCVCGSEWRVFSCSLNLLTFQGNIYAISEIVLM